MPDPRRQDRSRRTRAVLSEDSSRRPWWLEGCEAACEGAPRAGRGKSLRFRSGDPFDRLAPLRNITIVASILAPVLILAFSDFTPGLVEHDWSKDPMVEVQRSLIQGHDRSAIASLRGEIASNPGDAQLLRAMTVLAADSAPAEARRAYHQLNSLGQATPQDHAGHAALLARLHDFTGAKAILSNLPREAQETAQAQFAWLAVWREAGDFAAASTSLDQLLASVPEQAGLAVDLLNRVATATDVTADTRERIESALVRSLEKLMNSGRGQDVLKMAPALANLPVTHGTHRMKLGQILRNLPGQSVEHRLAAVRFNYPAQLPASEEPQLRTDYQNEIAWSGGLSAEEKDRVAAYLQSQEEHRLVSTLISPREALTEPKLFSRRLESLLELGQWREAGAMTASAEAPPLTHSRSLAQTFATLHRGTARQYHVEMMLGESVAAAQNEERALDCYAAGAAALDHHLPLLASTAFAAALDISKDRPKTLRAIIRSARQGGLPLGSFLRSLVGSPAMQDEAIQEQLIYLSLLTDQKNESMLTIVRNRRQFEPRNVYLRFLEALALHKTGAHGEAAALLVPLPQHRWHQGEAAVIASIIAASGQIDRSSALIQQIDPAQLFGEERAIFSPWQNRLNAAASLLGGLAGSE